eukprot:CAMPEP_0201575184 /NCGR_PEP_ID=MMETSP0190_2-20130828/20210_1 /ASSEMBLY_ACC=CAM_ASM_000263 /TAXON_ID=37353 /ORGANISM="Rosalina sp." /LENGTH=59 /DNA_ID=CAMNT_0048004473 /DNA_START=27 /DNA_END=206 /DNA_ORIENTATION=-
MMIMVEEDMVEEEEEEVVEEEEVEDEEEVEEDIINLKNQIMGIGKTKSININITKFIIK